MPEADTKNNDSRKNWISNAIRFVLGPSKHGSVVARIAKLRRGVRATELEREGNHKAAGERGGVCILTRKDAMWPQLATFSPRTYLSQVRDVTFFNFKKTQKLAKKDENSTWSGTSV